MKKSSITFRPDHFLNTYAINRHFHVLELVRTASMKASFEVLRWFKQVPMIYVLDQKINPI